MRHFHISHHAPYLLSKILHNLCFSFLLGITAVPIEIENNAYAKFGGQMKCIVGNVEVAYSARHHLINERGTGAEMCPAGIWDLGSLLETRRSAIGQFSSLALVTVPEVFAKKQLGPVSLSSVE